MRRRQITIVWQSFSILGKVPILITSVIMIPIVITLLALALPILLLSTFIVLFLFLLLRWTSILITFDFNTGDMKVPTFYSSFKPNEEEKVGMFFVMSVTGAVFGGIHCAGWFFTFPSSDEATLWRVCSAVLTSIAFFFPLLLSLGAAASGRIQILTGVAIVIVLAFNAYVLSRLLLLVEAFISLRHLTPGMLALVKWTSFIPHI